MNPFDVLLITPITNLMLIFYKLMTILHLPGALGLSIIILTAAIRMILWPLTTSQLKSSQKMSALKPHLDRLKIDHGNDKVRHQQEISKLYKEHGVNPAAGCLPLILQIPVFISLYQVLIKVVSLQPDTLASINDRLYFPFINLTHVPDSSFLAFKLTDKPNQWHTVGFLILLVPIATGLFQYIQSRMMTPQTAPNKAIQKIAKDKKGDSMEDTMAQMQSQMIFIMPAMIAFFSYGFPLGLSLYWNTFTLIGIIQQYVVAGAGPFNKYLPKKWQK